MAWPKPQTPEEIQAELEAAKERHKLEKENLRAELDMQGDRIRAENARIMAATGRTWRNWGSAALAFGFAFSVLLKRYGWQILGHVVAGCGMAATSKGLYDMKAAEHYTIATWAPVIAGILVFFLWLARDFGLWDFILNKKKPREETENDREQPSQGGAV